MLSRFLLHYKLLHLVFITCFYYIMCSFYIMSCYTPPLYFSFSLSPLNPQSSSSTLFSSTWPSSLFPSIFNCYPQVGHDLHAKARTHTGMHTYTYTQAHIITPSERQLADFKLLKASIDLSVSSRRILEMDLSWQRGKSLTLKMLTADLQTKTNISFVEIWQLFSFQRRQALNTTKCYII